MAKNKFRKATVLKHKSLIQIIPSRVISINAHTFVTTIDKEVNVKAYRLITKVRMLLHRMKLPDGIVNFKPDGTKYIGKMKKLNRGIYTREEINARLETY